MPLWACAATHVGGSPAPSRGQRIEDDRRVRGRYFENGVAGIDQRHQRTEDPRIDAVDRDLKRLVRAVEADADRTDAHQPRVGLAAVGLGKIMGARVIAAASTCT